MARAVTVIFLLVSLTLGVSAVDRTLISGESGADVVNAVVNLIQHSCIFPNYHLLLRRIAYVETGDGTYPRTYAVNNNGGIWQVDQSMFATTQQGGDLLQPVYDDIRIYFGIDWRHVNWSDLRKPLYSGLAAAIYVLVQSQGSGVPIKPESQGAFLQSNYDSSMTPYNFTAQISQIPLGCSGTHAVDVAFLIDATVTSDDFLRIQDFLNRVVRDPRMPIAPDRVRVAVLQFSSAISTEFRLDAHLYKGQVQTAINAIRHHSGGQSRPHTVLALQEAIDRVFAPAYGGRPNAAKAAFIISDSVPNDVTNLASVGQRAKDNGIAVFVIDAGQNVGSVLEPALTSPACEHVIKIKDYHDIRYTVDEVLKALCNVPLYTNRQVTCEIGECTPIAFTTTAQGLTIMGNLTCGSVNIFTAFHNANPSSVYYDIQKVLTPTDDIIFYAPQPSFDGDHLYVKVQDALYQPNSGCMLTLTPYVGDRRDTSVHVMCELGNRIWECNATDLPPSIVDEICKNAVFTFPQNPCTAANIKQGHLKFPDPYDSRKFIQCDLSGRMYVTQCPEGQVYSSDCQYCKGAGSPSLSNCNKPLTGFSNPCTAQNILAGHFYFEYPGDETKYIQCDVWGHAFVRDCQIGYVWRERALTCEHSDKYNPCPSATNGHRFFPYPGDPYKYIECNLDGISFVMNCDTGEVWNDFIKTCDRTGGGFLSSQAMTQFPTTHRPSGTVHGGWRCSHVPFRAPCTAANIHAQKLYYPHVDPHMYIQCDLNGYCWEQSCSGSDTYDPYSHTCVDGPIHVDCPDMNNPLCLHP